MHSLNCFRHTDARKAEIQVTDHLLGTIGWPSRDRYCWIIPIPSFRKPIAYPFFPIVRHVVNPQGLGRQATANRNVCGPLSYLFIKVAMGMQRFTVMSRKDPLCTASVPSSKLPLRRRR